MDGRLIFAHCGYALLLASHLTGSRGRTHVIAIGSALGLFLASVTSGTFYSAFAALIVLTLCSVAQAQTLQDRINSMISLVFCTILYHSDLLAALTKNMTYYGGGMAAWTGMFGHGAGAFFAGVDIVSVKFAVLTLCLMSALAGLALV